jgi:hypothetical protein
MKMSFLSCPRALPFYRIDSLHPPRHPVPAAVRRDTTQGISRSINRVELCLIFLNDDGLLTDMCQSYACVYPRRPTKPCSVFQHMRPFLYVDIRISDRVLPFSRVRDQGSLPPLIEIRGFLKAESDFVEFPMDRF